MPEQPPLPPDGSGAVPEVPRVVVDRPAPDAGGPRPPGPRHRDPRLDSDELRLMIDQAHADVRRAESIGPALAMGALLACLPLLVVLLGLLL